MKRIEPFIGDMAAAGPTPEDRESARRRRRAKSAYERLLVWQAAMFLLLALLSGVSGYVSYRWPDHLPAPRSYVDLFIVCAIMLMSAYMTTRRGIVGLAFAVGTPATLGLLNLVLAQRFTWGQLFTWFMVMVGLVAVKEWRQSRN